MVACATARLRFVVGLDSVHTISCMGPRGARGRSAAADLSSPPWRMLRAVGHERSANHELTELVASSDVRGPGALQTSGAPRCKAPTP